ncbi:MAG: BBP7 family outer membrane beta-barrel protein [Pirellulales bacterium]
MIVVHILVVALWMVLAATLQAADPLAVESTTPTPSGSSVIGEPSIADRVIDGDAKTEEFMPSDPLLTGRFWVDKEFLFWWGQGAKSPALVTGSPAGTPIQQAGLIGAPGTRILAGNQPLNGDVSWGGQWRGGVWLDDCRTWGLEAGVFFLDDTGDSSHWGSSDGSLIVSRPFVDAISGQNNAQLISYPGVLAGTVDVDSSTTSLWGLDVVNRFPLCCCQAPGDCDSFSNYSRWDLLAGYRHFALSDQLRIEENLFPLEPTFVPGTQLNLVDQFRASNQFDGLVMGLLGERWRNRLYGMAAFRLNVGQVTRHVDINGQTTVTVPGNPTAIGTGGLYALPSNIGSYRDADWTVLPELQLRLGRRLYRRWTVFGGYQLLIWPHVARAAEQIDTVVNTELLPPPLPLTGPYRPAYTGHTSTFWLQGLSLGIDCRF